MFYFFLHYTTFSFYSVPTILENGAVSTNTAKLDLMTVLVSNCTQLCSTTASECPNFMEVQHSFKDAV